MKTSLKKEKALVLVLPIGLFHSFCFDVEIYVKERIRVRFKYTSHCFSFIF